MKGHITQILAAYDIPLNDPLAAVISVMFATNLENLKQLNQAPSSFQTTIQDNVEQFAKTAKHLEERLRGMMATQNLDLTKELSSGLTQAVGKAVTRHCKKIDVMAQRQVLLKVSLPISCFVLFILLGGVGLGTLLWSASAGRRETGNQADWLDTPEGQTAKQISQWNAETIRHCQNQLEQLEGKCVIWIIPPPAQEE